MHRPILILLAAPLLAAGAQRLHAPQRRERAESFEVPAWAWPGTAPAFAPPGPPYDATTPLALEGSARTFTLAQVKNQFAVPDWFHESHPAMPGPVGGATGRRTRACGFCHLADGQGRSENAALAGLSADYIVRQVHDFRDGNRREAMAKWPYYASMKAVADSVPEEDLLIAARYFAGIRPKPRYTVVERDSIQRSYEAGGLRALDPAGGREALGNRIIEISEDIERHDLRDPRARFISYVPPGSIDRGRRIARATGAKAPKACVTCHGPALRGVGPAPLIAGRSPAYIVRQLVDFRIGARDAATSGPMQQVTAGLSLDDMIAVAAYVGSLRPR